MKPITDTMHHIGNGFFIDTASEKMAELVKRVNESGKPGKIDLTISVKKLDPAVCHRGWRLVTRQSSSAKTQPHCR